VLLVLHEDDVLHLLGQLQSPGLGVVPEAPGWLCTVTVTVATVMIARIVSVVATATSIAVTAVTLTLGVQHEISDCWFKVHALPVPRPKGEGEGCVTSLCDGVGQTANSHHCNHIYG
jgi:hypothetical protein